MKMTCSDFIKKIFFGTISMSGISALALSCGGKEEEQSVQKENEDPCNDLSGLSKDDIDMRSGLEYVSVSPDKNKTCLNCEYYHASKNGKICGTCDLFKGPVDPNGYCSQWYIKAA
jgi:hypothetical protein